MEYYLEVYEPDESGAVAASYQSSSPFMALTIGEAIHGDVWILVVLIKQSV